MIVTRADFDALVLDHQAMVRGFIARFIPQSQTVFDVAQDVFIEAYRSMDKFNPEQDLGPWLRGIAVNKVRQYLRRESRLKSRELKAFEETLRRWKIERLSDSDDRLDALRDCVGRLDKESRHLVEQRYFHAVALEEIAAAVKKNAGTLAMQLLRIRAALAKCVRAKLEAAR